jgi:Homeodomain-like domain
VPALAGWSRSATLPRMIELLRLLLATLASALRSHQRLLLENLLPLPPLPGHPRAAGGADVAASCRPGRDIGEALVARPVEGASRARVAAAAGVPADTVRRWLRRFEARAEEVRSDFAALAHRWDAELEAVEPQGSAARDALEAIGVAAAAGVRCFGPTPLWNLVAGASGGRLLSNTSCPLPIGG